MIGQKNRDNEQILGNNKSLLKKYRKKIIFSVIILLAFVLLWQYGQYKKSQQVVGYDTVKAERGDLIQTVEATGKVKSVNSLQLRFELSGKINEVLVKEGSQVSINEELMILSMADLNATVAQASANLNQRLAGSTDEEISYYQSAADMAKVSWDQAKRDAEHAINLAELNVQTAYNNLKLAEGGENSDMVINAYQSAVAVLQQSISVVSNALTQADNILGIDNAMANDDFEVYLSASDSTKKIIADNKYKLTRDHFNSIKNPIQNLTTDSDKLIITNSLINIELALSNANDLLLAVKDVLWATAPVGTLTQTILDAKKTAIDTTRNSSVAQYNTIISTRQNIESAKNMYETYWLAYEKVLRDAENTKLSSKSMVDLKESAYNQAVANLNLRKNPPREVDVAALRAVLAQALANRDKAVLKSPIDGTVTKVYKKRGEFASMSEVVMDMLSPKFQIEIDVPENDVVKIKLQDESIVTLDAYGDDVKFSGKVIAIDPAATNIMDVVYYRVTIALEENGRDIKPGMSANATIYTDKRDNVLKVPVRAVRTDEQGKYVRILKNEELEEVYVTLGIRADDGQIEIIDGLELDDEVIINIITP